MTPAISTSRFNCRTGFAGNLCVLLCSITLFVCSAAVAVAGPPTAHRQTKLHDTGSFGAIGAQYVHEIRPLLTQYCLKCHSTAKQKGDLDLERFSNLGQVRRDTKTWLKVAEMLDDRQMPPEEAKQPSNAERETIRGWVARYLHAEALAKAGDPGLVVLRRLSNAEYTYTIQDLTGVDLNPAREFPADGAAGEGFTNAGAALVMSPALLQKYFDAGREIAQHAVLLPDGFRFSASTSRSDWTNEVLAQIRGLYRKYSDAEGASEVNLQGIVFKTNSGGRLPLERYLTATFEVASAAKVGTGVDRAIGDVASKHGLSPKYLLILWTTLNDCEPSLLLDMIRASWRNAQPADVPRLAGEIRQWQRALWRFSSVGHIGKLGGPTAWQEPVTPLTVAEELRVKLPEPAAGEKDVTFYLAASDAGDGNDSDFVIWQRPRLVAPGRPDLLLRDVRDFTREMRARRERMFASTAQSLAAAAEASRSTHDLDIPALAKKYAVDVDSLTAWLDYLGIGSGNALTLDDFKHKLKNPNYAFIRGWGSDETPLLLANSSNEHVRVPGNMRPHCVCVHPSPTLCAAVGWRSPIETTIEIKGKVTHAHPECGNGVEWRLELRRRTTRQRLAQGIAQGGRIGKINLPEAVAVQPGDLVSLLVGPRDGNHACDLTDLELILIAKSPHPREWSLTRDVSGNVLEGNPHADRFGNPGVWHFYSEPVKADDAGGTIPFGSLLSRWQTTEKPAEKARLATAAQNLLMNGPSKDIDKKSPDALLYRQLSSLGGPLFMRAWPRVAAKSPAPSATSRRDQRRGSVTPTPNDVGIDPTLFGKHPNGSPIDEASLCVHAPSVIEVHLPADLTEGAEFVTTGSLDPQTGAEGSVQLRVLSTRPTERRGLVPISVTETTANGSWTSNNQRLTETTPIVVNDTSAARRRIEKAFDQFRAVFPIALCYSKIVPVDEVVTLTLYYREDEALRRLLLSDTEIRQLDRAWEELHFISRDSLKEVDALQQLREFATQDGDPKVFDPLRKPIHDRAEAYKQVLIAAEPRQIAALVDFAARAYRRPLSESESGDLHRLYRRLRQQGLSHEEAFRLTLARIFVSPDFLYRREIAPPGPESAAVSDSGLAVRLSYFLWSSAPDAQLRSAAAKGTLHESAALKEQARRMLRDGRIRRLAAEFACQWLHIYDFDSLSEKSEKFFPEFAELRGDMYEESIRFFAEIFEHDASVLDMLDADYTFVNDRLARFYGIADSTPSRGRPATGWGRVDGVHRYGRGGILALAATLANESGASRTSPILRGNWVSEVLLGEKVPKPPKDVPKLPESETATDGLTVRQLIEKHVSDVRCSACHQKFDGFGFALESFDAIGRFRHRDLGGRAIDTKTQLPDGTPVDGVAGLRRYLADVRRDAFLQQFCKKLLGYALGRGIQLSDGPLLAEMQKRLKANDYRFSAAVEVILDSRQFREIRGRDAQVVESGN